MDNYEFSRNYNSADQEEKEEMVEQLKNSIYGGINKFTPITEQVQYEVALFLLETNINWAYAVQYGGLRVDLTAQCTIELYVFGVECGRIARFPRIKTIAHEWVLEDEDQDQEENLYISRFSIV